MAIKVGEHYSTGSCRSIPEFNIIKAISQCRDLMTHFGGHSQAAGFTLPTAKLPLLEQRLLDIAVSELAGLDLRPHIDIDTEVSLSELSKDTFTSIQRLAPFGRGNPAPTFLSHNLTVIDHRVIGNNDQHLKLKVGQGNTIWDGIAFRMTILDFAPSS